MDDQEREPQTNKETRLQAATRNSGIVVLKYWHVILLVISQVLAYGAAYGRITANQDNLKEDVGRRLAVIESNKVISRDEFEAWRIEFQQNLRDLQQAIIHQNLEGK